MWLVIILPVLYYVFLVATYKHAHIQTYTHIVTQRHIFKSLEVTNFFPIHECYSRDNIGTLDLQKINNYLYLSSSFQKCQNLRTLVIQLLISIYMLLFCVLILSLCEASQDTFAFVFYTQSLFIFTKCVLFSLLIMPSCISELKSPRK